MFPHICTVIIKWTVCKVGEYIVCPFLFALSAATCVQMHICSYPYGRCVSVLDNHLSCSFLPFHCIDTEI